MHVVATAGHVDHGKSTLLRALTGTDPDRLAEEKQRGLSIELGYVWCDVAGVGDVAFIDVPGHQKFVKTALSGLGQVPVALVVVAADDPWMPQAAEHLQALDALGVERGVLVATRADLADPGPILAEARHHLRGTSLAGIPEVAVSARTGAGLEQLVATLAGVLRDAPAPPDEPTVRLFTDRRFSLRGSGTVVTGTLESGTVTVGDELEVHRPSGVLRVRVRAVEALGCRRDSISGSARAALELAGRAAREVERGDVLVTPGGFAHTDTVDVRLVPTGAEDPQRPPRAPILHLRSASYEIRLRSLDDRHARLRLPTALPLRVGDRALLRDPGSRRVWGVVVVDPAPPASAGRGFARRRAAELASLDLTVAADLEVRGLARRGDYQRWFGAAVELPPSAVTVGEWVLSARRASRATEDLTRLVLEASAAPTVTSAARTLVLPETVLERLAPASIRIADGRWVSVAAAPALSTEDRAALDALVERLHASPFDAPDTPTLASMGLDDGRAARLHKAGHLLRVAPGVVLLPGADEEATRQLADLAQPFTTSAARNHLRASRRTTLGLLGYLDKTGRTVRLADDTRRLRG